MAAILCKSGVLPRRTHHPNVRSTTASQKTATWQRRFGEANDATTTTNGKTPAASASHLSRRRRRSEVIVAAVSDPEAEEVKSVSGGGVARTLEFMVEMACGKCVSQVEAAVAQVPGVGAVVATLSSNTVRVVASTTTADDVANAVEAAGYKCRLIGQGSIDVFGEDLARRLGTDLRTLHQSLAAVAEFKGEVYGHGNVRGVVRFVQVDEDTTLIEGTLDGLAPGPHALVIHQYGDTTKGLDSVGGVFDVAPAAGEGALIDGGRERDGDDVGSIEGSSAGAAASGEAGRLGSVVADAEGHAVISSRVIDGRVKVWDVIGRSLAVHDDDGGGAAAVLARSAGVGENLKKVCQCDGTVIWESSPDDFTPVVVNEKKKGGGGGPLAAGGADKVSVRRE